MQPARAGFIILAPNLAASIAPSRLTPRHWCQASRSMSSIAAVGPLMPALAQSTSRPPQAAAISSNKICIPASELASETEPRMPAGSAAIIAASTSVTQTRSPCAAKACAITRPMPLAPAVTRTRLIVFAPRRDPRLRAAAGLHALRQWRAVLPKPRALPARLCLRPYRHADTAVRWWRRTLRPS